MTKHEVALVVPFLAVALAGPSTHAEQSVLPQPPVGGQAAAHHRDPRLHAQGRLLLAAREEQPRGHQVSRERERLHRRGDEADQGAAGDALQRDARTHQADRLERAVADWRLLLLLAHRGREAVPLHVPAQGQHGRRRRNPARPQRARRRPQVPRPRRVTPSATTATGWRIRPTRPAIGSTACT